MDFHRDAGAVINHPHRPVGQEGHLNLVGVAVHRLIARVVENLHQQVMEAVGAGRADVHAGALAHRLQAFQNLDIISPIFTRISVISSHKINQPHRAFIPPF